MFEKVNPCHPDKVADRIAGAIVDLCYTKCKNPKVACEVLIGHGECTLQIETSERLTAEELEAIVHRIAGEGIVVRALIVPQDVHLADNQKGGVKCGDNGIFKGCAPTYEQKLLTAIAASIYDRHPSDGKYIIQTKNDYDRNNQGQKIADVDNHEDGQRRLSPSDERNVQRDERTGGTMGEYLVTICQSHLSREQEPELREHLKKAYGIHLPTINPLGEWTGGINVDCGCTNRKLGSDLGDGVTGGGLNGKDLSKGDVSINIVAFLKAVQSGQTVTACCSIGDEQVTFQYADGKRETERFADIVEQARLYILTDCGGSFERFAEWGLLRPLAQIDN